MNKVKSFLLGYKLRFIKRIAPKNFDHWNEDNKRFNFYFVDGSSIEVIKPKWLIVLEFLAYKVF